MTNSKQYNLSSLMLMALGLVFVISSLTKAINLPAFSTEVRLFTMTYLSEGLASFAGVAAIMICALEMVIGLLMVFRKYSEAALICSTILLLFFAWLTGINAFFPTEAGSIESCGCFGELIHFSPISSFLKSVVLFVISLWLCIKFFRYKNVPEVHVSQIITVCLFLCTLSSCSLAEQNSFANVSDYFQKDSLKCEAAKYLEKYAGYHYGVSRLLVDANGKPSKLKPSDFRSDSLYRVFLDSLRYRLDVGKPVLDVDTITENYLIENINLAFDSWWKPWAKNIPFPDFCHYILPYRNGDEALTRWRPRFKREYEHLITDSMMQNANIKQISEFLMRQIRKKVGYGVRFNGLIQGFLTPEQTEQMGHVECKACANYAAMVMRACGIPCEVIEMHWRFTEVPHSSVLFPKTANNPRSSRLTIGDTLMYMGEPKDSMAAWRTWGYSYEPNDTLLQLANSKNVPKSFPLPVYRRDLTSQVSQTYDITLSIPDSICDKKWLFLCRFNNWNWYPIREGKIFGDSVTFYHSTIRQLYRLGYSTGDSVCTFGPVFSLTGKGTIVKYNQAGDSVWFKIAYNCDSTETLPYRYITTYCWSRQDKWMPIKRKALLWCFNAKTGEYKPYNKLLGSHFKPVFHLLEAHLPKWTVFTDSEQPRPIGYISKDPITGEGLLMQF